MCKANGTDKKYREELGLEPAWRSDCNHGLNRLNHTISLNGAALWMESSNAVLFVRLFNTPWRRIELGKQDLPSEDG